VKVAYDVSPLSLPRAGVGNYVLASLRGLVECGADIVAFAPVSARGRRHVEESLAGLGVELRLVTLPLARAWRAAWSRLGWPPAERWLGTFDVLHFSDWMFPPQRSGVRATTIHDLVPLRFPEWATPHTARLHRAKALRARADVYVCNSSFTAGEARELLGLENTAVAYPAPGPAFTADGERADLGGPYVLSVATLEPRKNLDAVLGVEGLVVAGGSGWGERTVPARHLGYVSDDELARLYRGADVFVFPSRFEGFGIPVLEAMASGVPVVASSHPSLDEACGDAALRADPDDPSAWTERVGEARERHDELLARGRAHVARFTTRAMGEAILRAYDQVA
jgi:glycosyltransferase involved in cell wall biosynthesis